MVERKTGPSAKMTTQTCIRWPPDELARIYHLLPKDSGVTLSEFIRRAALRGATRASQEFLKERGEQHRLPLGDVTRRR